MAGVYSADGGFNVTVVGENDLPIGLYAANGSIRVTQDVGLGLYAPNGAWRIGDSGTGVYTSSGALNGVLSGGVFFLRGAGGRNPQINFEFISLVNPTTNVREVVGIVNPATNSYEPIVIRNVA